MNTGDKSPLKSVAQFSAADAHRNVSQRSRSERTRGLHRDVFRGRGACLFSQCTFLCLSLLVRGGGQQTRLTGVCNEAWPCSGHRCRNGCRDLRCSHVARVDLSRRSSCLLIQMRFESVPHLTHHLEERWRWLTISKGRDRRVRWNCRLNLHVFLPEE